jgi:hypothetical protein
MVIVGPGGIGIEDGWVSPRYGIKEPAPIISMRSQPQRNALFVTAIVPQPDSPAPVAMSVTTSADETLAVTLSGIGPTMDATDRILWRPGGAPFALPDLRGVADVTWRREHAEEGPFEFCGARLRDGVDGAPLAPWLLSCDDEVWWGSYGRGAR